MKIPIIILRKKNTLASQNISVVVLTKTRFAKEVQNTKLYVNDVGPISSSSVGYLTFLEAIKEMPQIH